MSEALRPSPSDYPTFNAFFIRRLKPGARVPQNAAVISPADGCTSQAGPIAAGRLIQAKGHTFTVLDLLGGDGELALRFNNGAFATIYLSPRDYHRVHMPCDGRLVSMVHVPGDLYSVNPATVAGVSGLFARNERVVCHFQTPWGEIAVILVGAAVVGSIGVVWHGPVRPQRPSSTPFRWDYRHRSIELKKGEELGWFSLGSTVIVLLPPRFPRLRAGVTAGQPIRCGEALAD